MHMCTRDERDWSVVVHAFMDPQDCPHQKNVSICPILIKNACLSFTDMQPLQTRREIKALLTMMLSFPLLLLACIRHAKCSLAWREMLTRTRDIRGEWNKEKLNIFEEIASEEALPALFFFFFGARPDYSDKVISITCPFYFPLECLAIGRQNTSLNLEYNKLMLGRWRRTSSYQM